VRIGGLLLAILAAAALAAQDLGVEVLSVRNRPAADLVPALQPLAGPDGSVTSMENRIIVRAGPEAMRQIKAVLQQLDVAPRSLWISVRQATAQSSAARSAGVTGSIPVGDGGVRLTREGGTVTTTRSRTVVSGSFGASGSTETGSDVARILALEGRPAFIQAGSAVPVAPVVVVPSGATVVTGTAYVEANSGFWVLPRIAGEVVTLELATTKDALGAGAVVDQRHVRTTLSARLGDWVHVAGIAADSATRSSGLATTGSADTTSDWNVDLRVEAAAP
jgi:type II secretory pathway component GspD/PulD (secretin)